MEKYIYEAFKNAADKFADKIALVYLGKKYTYSQLYQIVELLATAMHDIGIKKHDRVVIYQPHCPQWIVEWLAILRIGAVAVPVTHFYGARELKYIIQDSGAETIFCMDSNYNYIAEVMSETNLKRVVVTNILELLPSWKKFIAKAYNKLPESKPIKGKGIFTFSELLKRACSPLSPFSSAEDSEELAELLYTGGTTGFPKGVPISNVLFVETQYEQRRMSESIIPRGEDVVLQGSPLYHVLGQAVGIGALIAGDMLILLPKLTLDAVFDHIDRYKVKSFFGTPTIYRMILEHDRLDRYSLTSLKYCFCAGDALPVEIERKWKEKFGFPISQGYGATETCGGITLTPAGEPAPEGTIGKLIPIREVMLVDPDTLEPVLDKNQGGELLVSSEHMVTGYWNKPYETEDRFIQLNGKLWYKTGDIIRVDPEGWYYFIDRTGDLIKHKGYRVSASKVESILQENPKVLSSCVIGIKDNAVGERIKAFVVLKTDVKGVTAEELRQWCRERLANYEVPQYIEFRDMLPKSKVGKLLRREVRSQEERRREIR